MCNYRLKKRETKKQELIAKKKEKRESYQRLKTKKQQKNGVQKGHVEPNKAGTSNQNNSVRKRKMSEEEDDDDSDDDDDDDGIIGNYYQHLKNYFLRTSLKNEQVLKTNVDLI